jgi:sugar phosphate isomerase/epimerase
MQRAVELALSATELEDGEPIAELLEAACAEDIRFIELWHPQNTRYLGVDGTLAAICDAGLQVACISTGTELYRNGGSAEDQAGLLEALEIARRAGAPLVNTYFGYAERRDDERAASTYVRYLSPCLRRAEELGVTIVLENEFNAFGLDRAASDLTRRPGAVAALCARVGSPWFRLNFDPANFHCAGVLPYPDAYEVLKPFIKYCHVKDVRAVARDTPTQLPDWREYSDFESRYWTCPLGMGQVPWAAIIRRLRADRYHGFLTLEPHCARHYLRFAWRDAARWLRAQGGG